jgi:hypothetical protein
MSLRSWNRGLRSPSDDSLVPYITVKGNEILDLKLEQPAHASDSATPLSNFSLPILRIID